jgi:6-pyruvoyltetrahydropterin/6-carboxytetrahydropterin synthase
MTFRLTHTFRFEAAHRLPNVPSGHKCARLHGHSFVVDVVVAGDADPKTGWVVDFGELEAAWAPLHELLDHRYLNEVEGLSNPTSENIARFIWDRLRPTLPTLRAVVLQEICVARCEYRGPATTAS